MRPLILYLVLIAGLMLPACNRSETRQTESPAAIPVIAEPVRLGTIRGTVSATGVVTTLPGATFTLSAQEPARIAEIAKNVGEAVKSGEILIRFEFPSLRAQTAVNAAAVKAADVRLQQAVLLQGRIRSLLSRGAASQREMDDADREVALAEGELAAAKMAMNATEALGQNTIVRAPFNGIVTERLHGVGDLVRAGEADPILRLIDPKQVQVTATVSIADISRVAIGATGRAVAERVAQGTAELLRVVSRSEPERGATTGVVMLAFEFPTDLAPGTQVGVEIDAEQRSNVPLVPAFAVLKDDGQSVVVVAAGSVAQRRRVVIGLTDAEHSEIISGVKAGELIITQGHSSIRDGAPISVTMP